MKDEPLRGRTVLVTGASRGIGAETARTLGEHGATVVAHYGGFREGVGEAVAAIAPDRRTIIQADMVSVGLSATPERRKSISFSRPYVPYAQILAAAKSDTTPATIAAWNSEGKTITSLQGSTAEALVKKTFPNATSSSFPDQNAAFLEVSTGRANGIVVENYLLAQFNKSNNNALKEVPFPKPLHVEYGSYAVQKGNLSLVQYLSKYICSIQKSGAMGKAYKATIGAPLPQMPPCK